MGRGKIRFKNTEMTVSESSTPLPDKQERRDTLMKRTATDIPAGSSSRMARSERGMKGKR